MARARPGAAVSDWMVAVSDALPHPRRQTAPYTLAEAVSELGAYAQSTAPSSWRKLRAVLVNRESLSHELSAQREPLGPRLRSLIDASFDAVHQEEDQQKQVLASSEFIDRWRSEAAITSAFEDLCEEAKNPAAGSVRLRQLAELIASQLGAEATSHFSPLRDAAEVLVTSEEELSRWTDLNLPQPFDEAARVHLAREMLTSSTTGKVVVWAVYSRATAWGMRTDLGSVVVLRPEWAVPNAFDDKGEVFPERDELREIRERVRWLDGLHQMSTGPNYRLALVRVDLGERHVAGATEDARRLVHALLAVPVTMGGVGWRDTGTSALLLDGRVRTQSVGPIRVEHPTFEDTYGVGATGEILHEIENELGPALRSGPMPEPLIEALSCLREARMTDHRDVRFYGARPVSPRFATALEDHAMELIASVLEVRADRLAEAMELGYGQRLAGHRVSTLLLSPFEHSWVIEQREHREELERAVSRYDGGRLIVSIANMVAHQERIRSLTMTPCQRADFEEGILISTDPTREHLLLRQAREDAALLRARHRRVRNAVNHGLPLAPATLGSVREYAESTSQHCLDLALTWFSGAESGSTLLSKVTDEWSRQVDRAKCGVSWAAHEASS